MKMNGMTSAKLHATQTQDNLLQFDASLEECAANQSFQIPSQRDYQLNVKLYDYDFYLQVIHTQK